MRIQRVYSAIEADIGVAKAFYTRVFGRRPDHGPIENLIRRRDTAGAHIQILQNEENTGSSACTVVVSKED